MNEPTSPASPSSRAPGARGRWLPPLAWMALILFGSSRPMPEVPRLAFPHRDKIAHLTEYGVLGALLARAVSPLAAPGAGALVRSVGIGAFLGAADETFQRTTPGRTPSVFDWMADVLGLTLGGLLRRRWGLRREGRAETAPGSGTPR